MSEHIVEFPSNRNVQYPMTLTNSCSGTFEKNITFRLPCRLTLTKTVRAIKCRSYETRCISSYDFGDFAAIVQSRIGLIVYFSSMKRAQFARDCTLIFEKNSTNNHIILYKFESCFVVTIPIYSSYYTSEFSYDGSTMVLRSLYRE